MALLLRIYALFRCVLHEDSPRCAGAAGDADGGCVWARIGIENSPLHFALLGGYLFSNGLEVDFEGERGQEERQGRPLWSPTSQNRDVGHPHRCSRKKNKTWATRPNTEK